jgi:hypothetical protein
MSKEGSERERQRAKDAEVYRKVIAPEEYGQPSLEDMTAGRFFRLWALDLAAKPFQLYGFLRGFARGVKKGLSSR